MAIDSKLLRGDFLIMVAAMIWGVAFYFQKAAMDHIGPLLFLGLRGSVAALVLLPFAWRESRVGIAHPGRRFVWTALLAGCVFFVAAGIQQTGLVTATVTNTGFLTALYVVVTPFLFWLLKRQIPSRMLLLSTACALCGVWALSGGVGGLTRGDWLVALSSVFWAALIVVAGEASRFKRPLTYTCLQFVVVGLLGLLAAIVVEPVSIKNIVQASVSVMYVGVLSTALTFAIMAVALQHVPAPRASILLSLETLFAALAGYALLGERLSLLGWVGAVLILSAVLILQVRRAAIN